MAAPELDRATLSALAHADHPVAAPLSDRSVAVLLTRLPVAAGGTVVDVGCGGGQWLGRLLAARPDLRGLGLDTSQPALEAAESAGRTAGVADRVQWRLADGAAPLEAPADAALCVGSTHALGGLDAAVTALRERVGPGGSLLLGDGFWERPPSARAREVIGDLPDLPGVVAACTAAGWSVVDGHVSTAGEWDAYEWSWAGALTRWALAHPGPDGDRAGQVARQHLDEWLGGYRGQLGFVSLVLQS